MNDHAMQQGSILDKANAAFKQAAVKAIERARQTGTPLIVWEDGMVKEVSPDALESEEVRTRRKAKET